MARHELWELKQMQSLPFKDKIQMTRFRIKQWVDEFGVYGVYVSFSGGKDSIRNVADDVQICSEGKNFELGS